MTEQEIETLAEENHYLNNLVCLKQIWGLKMRVGIVVEDNKTKQCQTVQDLMDAGCITDPKFLVIDQHWDKLTVMFPQDIVNVLTSQ